MIKCPYCNNPVHRLGRAHYECLKCKKDVTMELVLKQQACCGAYDSESGCCQYKSSPQKPTQKDIFNQ